MSSILRILVSLLHEPRAALALARAAREQRRLERDYARRLLEVPSAAGAVAFPHLDMGWSEYFERNFFSILFLSIYRVVGIPRGRRLRYGMVTHAVRGIVTAADNILDDEDKGAVRVTLAGGRTLRNITSVLLQESVLHGMLDELSADPAVRRRVRAALDEALLRIAIEESAEEEAVEEVFTPELVMDSIHALRGGALLELAFIAPQAGEPDLAGRLAEAREAVGAIGLGLQAMDDLTDFAEDIRRRNHNLLRSWVVHRGEDGPVTDADLSALPDERLARPEDEFPRSTRAVLRLAIDTALDGFDRLHVLGHPITREVALRTTRVLLDLRHLPHLWRLYEAGDASV